MKRMYVVLSIMFAIVFWAGTLLGQQNVRPIDDNETTQMEKRLKMREEMHRRMMNKLLHGIGPDQDMFTDMEQMMDEIMTDSFNGMSFSAGSENHYQMEWLETKTGRTLAITPKDPAQNLDINVSNGLVVIKGKKEHKSAHGVSYSNFSNSFNVPDDCDPTKVKIDQKEGKILVQFPYRSAKPVDLKPQDKRVPLPPSKDDVQV